MVAESHVLGPVFRRYLDGHAGLQTDADHTAVDAFGMHVDFNRPPRAHDAFEYGLPEIVAAFRNTAFAVHAERKTSNRRAGFQQQRQRVAAIWRMRFWRKSLDVVVGVRTVGPLVSVSPDTELKVEASQ